MLVTFKEILALKVHEIIGISFTAYNICGAAGSNSNCKSGSIHQHHEPSKTLGALQLISQATDFAP